jgi:hypothetical protein
VLPGLFRLELGQLPAPLPAQEQVHPGQGQRAATQHDPADDQIELLLLRLFLLRPVEDVDAVLRPDHGRGLPVRPGDRVVQVPDVCPVLFPRPRDG